MVSAGHLHPGRLVRSTGHCYGPATISATTVTIHRRQRILRHRPGACSIASGERRNLSRSQSSPIAIRLVYHGDITITPHLAGLIGFQYRGRTRRGTRKHLSTRPSSATNYDYLAPSTAISKIASSTRSGAASNTIRSSALQTIAARRCTPTMCFDPRNGVFSGTRILFQLWRSPVREPKLTDQDESLYASWSTNKAPSDYSGVPHRLARRACDAHLRGRPRAILSLASTSSFRSSYFHNEFGKEIEYVGLDLIPALLPNLTPPSRPALETILQDEFRLRADHQLRGISRSGHRNIGRVWNRLRPVSPWRLHLPRRRHPALIHQR